MRVFISWSGELSRQLGEAILTVTIEGPSLLSQVLKLLALHTFEFGSLPTETWAALYVGPALVTSEGSHVGSIDAFVRPVINEPGLLTQYRSQHALFLCYVR
jgi:hypothetical protein